MSVMFASLSQAAKSDDLEEKMETETSNDGLDGEKDKEEKKEEEKKAEPAPDEDPKRHGFLILSREDSTMVMDEEANNLVAMCQSRFTQTNE